MTRKAPPEKPSQTSAVEGREDRLKAALKANLARRKAQARARAAPRDDGDRNEQKNKD